MELIEQARLRADLARRLKREPVRWIVSESALAELRNGGAEDLLVGIPVEVGQPRSEWGLDLLVSAAAPQASEMETE